MKLTIELCRNRKGPQRFWFRVKAANGRILASSEKYVRFIDCRHSAKQIATCLEWKYKGAD